MEDFGSASEIEIMSIQSRGRKKLKICQGENIKNEPSKWEQVRIQKIDLLSDPTSNKLKTLRAMLRIDNQIIQTTVDTRSPVSFLNWATTK